MTSMSWIGFFRQETDFHNLMSENELLAVKWNGEGKYNEENLLDYNWRYDCVHSK